MCSRVQCHQCSKPSWAGCGAHIEQVLGDVPEQERCQCRAKREQPSAAGSFQDIWAQLMGERRNAKK